MKERNYEKTYKTDIDLIPPASGVTGSYVCTWWNQSAAASRLGLTGTGLSEWRDALNQDAIFGEENFYHPISREQRGDLIFLLDDGWDIPIGTPNDAEHRHFYGAVDPDKVKFSRFGDTPQKRLKGISDKVKEMGYAGLGLWISPQQCGENEYDKTEARLYWEERAKWCSEAGVLYWKVDWGTHDYDDEYRKMMTECARRYAPGLIVEHAVVQLPCTHQNYSKDFAEERVKRVGYQMTFSDVYRTYDILEPFEKVCTLQRAHEALSCDGAKSEGLGLVNAENMYMISAALGLTAGIMNHTKETDACLAWHRIAPPFGIKEGTYTCSEERLEDTLFFETEICDWAPCYGRTVRESAPAVMARNCPLPTVKKCGDNAPFVIASKNPRTGAYSVAAVRRTVDPDQLIAFPADVTVHEVDPGYPVGIFGIFNSLSVEFTDSIPENARILAQDLTSNCALDITEAVAVNDGRIELDGKLLRILGKWSRGNNDRAEPALVLKIMK